VSAGPDWLAPVRQRHLDEPLAGGYRMEALAPDAYWELFEAEMRPHYPPEVFFDLDRLLAERDRQAVERLMDAFPPRVADPIAVRLDGELAAMFFGAAGIRGEYWMISTVVKPAHRRRGLYAAIVDRVIAYARDAGFVSVVSQHAPNNLPVMIAKLKAGFVIEALEIDARVGPSVRLRRYLHPAYDQAFAYRCGEASLDPALIHAGIGAMPALRAQFAAAERAAPPPDPAEAQPFAPGEG
jgi:GNAT superfamily N-acetyltransferase